MRLCKKFGSKKSPENIWLSEDLSCQFSLITECLISGLHSKLLQGVLEVSNCSSPWFNPCRARWQAPMASANLWLTLLCVKLITNENLPFSTGNSTQFSMVNYMVRKSKKEGIYVYIWSHVTTLFICSLSIWSINNKNFKMWTTI